MMKYIDLHCDTVTECVDGGRDIFENDLQVDVKRLKSSGCAAQCFAIFTDGNGAREKFSASLDYFFNAVKRGGILTQIKTRENLKKCLKSDIVGGVLTVEGLSFLGGEIEKIPELSAAGVRICSLVWNNRNALASPNLVMRGNTPDFSARRNEGLTALGREAVELLDENGILIDISHLSDGGAREILRGRKIPTVATHSNCAVVFDVSRNLTDELIRSVADSGGVVGLNFCRDFLGFGEVAGACAATAAKAVAAHAKHLINVGGEGVLALGGDLDGIPVCEGLEGCEKIPALLEYLCGVIGYRATEALACKNAARVLQFF